jgi:predicted nucleic acid-binding protein
MTYADTSFIVSAYARDVHTGAARDYVQQHQPRLPFTFLHWPETLRSLVLNYPDGKAIFAEVEADLAECVKLQAAEVDSTRAGRRAAGLLRANLGRWKALRSLDALHVAAAVECGAKTFLSFDTQSWQRLLAHTQRLQVWPPLTAEEKQRLA